MTVTINGTTGVSLCDTNSVPTAALQASAVTQPKVGAGVAGNGPAFSAYQNSATSLTSLTATKLQFQAEEYDTANCFDSSTNYRFTPNVAGYYLVNGAFRIGTASTGLVLWLYKNGSAYKELSYLPATAGSTAVAGGAQVYLNGTTDYIELYAQQNAATQNSVTGSATTYFQAALVRSA